MIMTCFFVIFISVCHALPNFVFILTDDQDLTLRSMEFMNKTTTLIANQGKTFTNFFVNSPICCPSRSTILTGKYAHNIQVYNNSIHGGCSSLQWQVNQENATIASILKMQQNYKTFYAGKYLNQYGDKTNGGVAHVPWGYDSWLGLQGNSKYYNYTLSINGSGQFFSDAYLTDKITNYSLNFLDVNFRENFFMMLAPPACHSPFTPAQRHAHWFPNLKTVRSVPFNTTPIDKHWLVEMPPTRLPTEVDILDDIYRDRIRTLQAVDEMVEAIIEKLEILKVLDNTYLIFASDNGFHIGQFTQPWDKRQLYDSDIRVPFLMRGPKIPKKSISEFPVAAVDILPTILHLANIENEHFDGQSFKEQLFLNSVSYSKRVLVEYWGEGDAHTIDPECPWGPDNQLAECVKENWCKCQDSKNNTYSCVLDLSDSSKFKFCAFEGGFIESYDLIEDPFELHNLKSEDSVNDYYSQVLYKLKKCSGKSCHLV